MGKFITFMVGAVVLGVSYLVFSGQRTTLETHEQQNDYQFQGIANNGAQSGFDRAVSAIQRDLMAVADSFSDVTMGDSQYDLAVIKNLYGDLTVVVNSESGGSEYAMEGDVLFTAPLSAAFMVEDDGVVVSGSGNYQISGVDRRMPSRSTGAGFTNPVRGIMTTESHVEAITGWLDMNRVVGIGTEPDDPVNHTSVVAGFSETEIEAMYQEAITKAHTTISTSIEGALRESMLQSAVSSSNAGNPKIVRVQGDLTVTSSMQGYGMLIVEDGDLNIASADFDWEGLILLRKASADTMDIDLLNTTLYGSLIAYDADNGPVAVECVPDFTIVGDEAVVNDSFTVSITVLGAAITAGGAYDMPVTTRIHVGGQTFEPFGDWDLPVDANINTGNSGVTYSWEPTTVFPAGSTISLDGRSWSLIDGEDGDQNSEWTMEMEENSSTAGPQIYLLEDGNSVPSVGGFMGQYSVEEFLSEYIENDELVLNANQAVSLFELGTTDTGNSAFDLQDLVVLVTMVDASQSTCYAEGAPSLFDIALNNGTEIHYSSEAIAKLGLHLDAIRNNTSVQVARSVMRGTGQDETTAYQESLTADDREEEEATGGTTATVCHYGTTKTISESALGAHIGHGDYMGSCY